MHSPSLEERVRQLERQFADFRAKFGNPVLRTETSRPSNAEKVSESYWKARAARLAKLQILQPLDSTQAVSEDRDRP